jgi:hypothetical protein
MGVHLMGMYLTSVHLMGVYLINVYLIGVCTSWTCKVCHLRFHIIGLVIERCAEVKGRSGVAIVIKRICRVVNGLLIEDE